MEPEEIRKNLKRANIFGATMVQTKSRYEVTGLGRHWNCKPENFPVAGDAARAGAWGRWPKVTVARELHALAGLLPNSPVVVA